MSNEIEISQLGRTNRDKERNLLAEVEQLRRNVKSATDKMHTLIAAAERVAECVKVVDHISHAASGIEFHLVPVERMKNLNDALTAIRGYPLSPRNTGLVEAPMLKNSPPW